METINQKAARAIREALIEKHISQAELARRLSVSQQSVTMALSGRRGMSLELIGRYAAAIGMDVGIVLVDTAIRQEVAR